MATAKKPDQPDQPVRPLNERASVRAARAFQIQVALTLADAVRDEGVTRSEVARRVGTSPGNITVMLSGDGNPTLARIARIALALGKRATLTLEDIDDE